MTYIVDPEWVNDACQREDVRIVDCRFQLGEPEAGKAAYEKEHLPGAVHIDLERDLSAPAEPVGGRHPLPDMDEFADILSEAGIDHHTDVVAYDDQGGAMAARFWWMMMYAGHERTFVMDRPFSLWKEEGYPVESRQPELKRKEFILRIQPQMLASIEEVKLALHEESSRIIDGRDERRYRGETDPVDHTAGHIPGAGHYFWKDVLDEHLIWKGPKELKDHFQHLPEENRIYSYCGSGVTACVNVLALNEAGYENPRLYAGSWSDWISYGDLPVEKG
ncbi:sulfurtransferase [Salibacterium halotolerans]|uniref:Thiosulfate/3-mercaptopyruvate sulfurtransferase n=1 Tax=Salibacterium halotolerans TaxID=1884432 RepID=A0A1I5QB64_9BACI|nr:sulfurtransferase [Salibacterium halotolerans]SFP43076.1 thiosulfate/3-mercaptopyruvate sulfurtransferase [Salibacterium halotolerans]